LHFEGKIVMAFAIARMAKQKGRSVGSSSLHNGRGRETPNADPSREKDNRVLLGDDRPVQERVREIIHEHGGKPRSDSVEAVEILVTASPEWWRDDHDEIDLKKVDQFSERTRVFLSKRENLRRNSRKSFPERSSTRFRRRSRCSSTRPCLPETLTTNWRRRRSA
jgi:hypothetical protein